MPAALMGPTVVPVLEVPTLPVQPSPLVPPLAAQEIALVVFQLSLVLPPV